MELNTPRLAGSAPSGGLDDQVYNRLLKERIIFLGSVVEDSMAGCSIAGAEDIRANDKMVCRIIKFPGSDQSGPPLMRGRIGREGMADPDHIVFLFIQPSIGVIANG